MNTLLCLQRASQYHADGLLAEIQKFKELVQGASTLAEYENARFDLLLRLLDFFHFKPELCAFCTDSLCLTGTICKGCPWADKRLNPDDWECRGNAAAIEKAVDTIRTRVGIMHVQVINMRTNVAGDAIDEKGPA